MKSKSIPALIGLTACMVVSTSIGEGSESASPLYGVQLPVDYRDWKLISVAHEAGNLNDIRAIVGNDIALRAYRDGTRPFPDGTIIARLAWKYVSSEENNAIFGQAQSFIPGAPVNVQISMKDSKRYADTGGWGYAQFEGGKPNQSEELMTTCSPCHLRANKSDDLVFTHYTP